MKKQRKDWNRGDMTFENRACKPRGMSTDVWLNSKRGRAWISKDDEMPSAFLARIIRDEEASGANILPHLLDDLAGRSRNSKTILLTVDQDVIDEIEGRWGISAMVGGVPSTVEILMKLVTDQMEKGKAMVHIKKSKKTGRNGIGYEINPEYEPVIRKRIMADVPDILTFSEQKEEGK